MISDRGAVPMQENPVQHPALDAVAAILRRLCKAPELVVTPSTRVDDLPGMDSLRRLHLVAMVEDRFGMEVDLAVMQNVRCVGDLLLHLQAQSRSDWPMPASRQAGR